MINIEGTNPKSVQALANAIIRILDIQAADEVKLRALAVLEKGVTVNATVQNCTLKAGK